MRALTFRSFAGVAIAAVVALASAYLLASQPPLDDMTAPLHKILPRASSFAQQVASARTYLPALQKPFAASTSSTLHSGPLRTHNFSTTTAKMTHDTITFKDAIQNRRTIYQLTKKSPISDEKIKDILTTAIKDVPSSFNSQSTRLVVLLKDEHDKFWNVVTEILKAHVPEDKWEHTEQRLAGFSGAYGTVLFYEDPKPVQALQEKLPQYADKFPPWSEHTSAMHQYMLWTAFEAEGLGCNLQHYNPLPDQKASDIWNIPLEWSLKAQLVFGQPAEGARENLPNKTFEPVEKRLFIHGA